jgi:hypothetical protein
MRGFLRRTGGPVERRWAGAGGCCCVASNGAFSRRTRDMDRYHRLLCASSRANICTGQAWRRWRVTVSALLATGFLRSVSDSHISPPHSARLYTACRMLLSLTAINTQGKRGILHLYGDARPSGSSRERRSGVATAPGICW